MENVIDDQDYKHTSKIFHENLKKIYAGYNGRFASINERRVATDRKLDDGYFKGMRSLLGERGGGSNGVGEGGVVFYTIGHCMCRHRAYAREVNQNSAKTAAQNICPIPRANARSVSRKETNSQAQSLDREMSPELALLTAKSREFARLAGREMSVGSFWLIASCFITCARENDHIVNTSK